MIDYNFEILHEDSDTLIINKQSGILTIPDRFNRSLPNLYGLLKERYGEIFVVHRLDRDTSGALVFAKTAEAHKFLNQQFQDKTAKKLYHAVVAGAVHQDEIRIDIPLMANPARKGTTIPSARGKESLTIMKVIKKFRVATLVQCELVTGRPHQLRAHVSAVGYPLLIDEVYGNSANFLLSTIKKRFKLKKDTDEKPVISRITMHAFSIELDHPNGGKLFAEAPYPKDFSALLQVLGKYSALPESMLY